MEKNILKTLPPLELAQLLDCTVNTVYAHASAGLIPHMKFGRSYIFPEAAIAQWLQTEPFQQAQMRRAANEALDKTSTTPPVGRKGAAPQLKVA